VDKVPPEMKIMRDLKPRNAASSFIYSHGPLGPSAQVLLDLPVLTDTKQGRSCEPRHLGGRIQFGVSRGSRGSADPLVLVRCEVCGLVLKSCHCVPGVDY